MPRHPALASYLLEHAIEFGDFELASGQRSDFYCDGRMVSLRGAGLDLICEAIFAEIEDLPVDAVGGMDMGATPIVAAFALRAHDRGFDIPVFVVRKEVKSHGTMKAIEGPIPAKPSRVVIVDDTVTSGGSIVRAIEKVQAAGHTVVLAISVLDRDQGGAEAMAALGVRYQPLVTIAEIRAVG